MYYDRKTYEESIAGSPLFSLDRDTSAYQRESYKMVENLYCYLLSIDERKYESCGCEIMETAIRCIRRFDAAKGEFLHYFNAAWKKEYTRLMGTQASDEKFRGIKITEDDRRNIRKYLRLAECMDPAFSKQELYNRIAEAMELPVQKVREIAEMADVSVSGDTADGEPDSFQLSDGISLEQRLISEDAVPELLLRIDKAFNSLQARQKPVIADLLTVRIWPELSDRHRTANRFSFISGDIVQIYIETGAMPAQRSIAAKYGRDEASVSRTVNEFLKRIKI